MHTLGDMSKELGKPAAYLKGLQVRFELPAFAGAGYSDAYLAFMRKLIFLRTLGVSEDAIAKLWQLEKKLMVLLHADEDASPTWFLDQCAKRGRPRQRLLLTNYDLGADLFTRKLQVLLPLRGGGQELFQGHEMGEDAMKVLENYLAAYERIRLSAIQQIKPLRAAATWAGRLPLKLN